jgi:hypothetical protein
MRCTAKEFPGLANWTNWCYAQPSMLLYDHKEQIESSCGVQQGDPLGPLYFCFALAPLVEEIKHLVQSTRSGTWTTGASLPVSRSF